MKTNSELANELRAIVSAWVNTFNFIQLPVLYKYTDDRLIEYIRPIELTWEALADYTGEVVETLQAECEELEEHPQFQSMMESKEGDNYPMWDTCFEFKQEESEDVIKAAIEAGFGVIEGLEDFNTILFVSGCGYSFYSAHWIPLYLALPWNKSDREKYKGVNYSGM